MLERENLDLMVPVLNVKNSPFPICPTHTLHTTKVQPPPFYLYSPYQEPGFPDDSAESHARDLYPNPLSGSTIIPGAGPSSSDVWSHSQPQHQKIRFTADPTPSRTTSAVGPSPLRCPILSQWRLRSKPSMPGYDRTSTWITSARPVRIINLSSDDSDGRTRAFRKGKT